MKCVFVRLRTCIPKWAGWKRSHIVLSDQCEGQSTQKSHVVFSVKLQEKSRLSSFLLNSFSFDALAELRVTLRVYDCKIQQNDSDLSVTF